MSNPVTVFGAGPAGLMAADVLAQSGIKVILADHKRLPGRKFLLAGRGGLNLTHSEPLDQLLNRYGAARAMLEPAIRAFPPDALRKWCSDLDEPTFVGSSGRVFPAAMKSSPLLRKWLRRLDQLGVTFLPDTAWQAFNDEPTVLALGGASWPELGSDAGWVQEFRRNDIAVAPFAAANSRQRVTWSAMMQERVAGSPLKNVLMSHCGTSARGDVIVSRDGLEGGPVYALSASLRDNPTTPLLVDLKPDMPATQVSERWAKTRTKDSFANRCRKAWGLSPTAIALLRECRAQNPKMVPVKCEGAVDLRRAISSAGGICRDEVDDNFRLRKHPSTIVIGEMLDWDAPTGGYLLQACLAMGHYAGMRLADDLASG